MLTDREKQRAYRERKYAAGYKQIRLWVPRNSEGKDVKVFRKAFAARVEEATAGWSKAKLAKLFRELITIIKEKEVRGNN
jgi:hypothetical protein